MQEYESHSYNIHHREIALTIYIYTSNNLTRTIISNMKCYFAFRDKGEQDVSSPLLERKMEESVGAK